ncbi:MAG TPA: hypothetical protein VFT04_12455 [Gemmatimonadales bacterium]|nr:hypothetical protein [Gemmatimonadales bacterium]
MANQRNFSDANRSDWNTEERWWRDNFSSRPYARSGKDFDYYRGAYRYGFENAGRSPNRTWDEAEPELRSGWEKYEHRGQSTWEDIKDSVRDAWHRVTGKGDTSTTHRM